MITQNNLIKVGVAGVLGYAGEELLKILSRHPKIKLEKLCDKASGKDKFLRDVYPALSFPYELKIEELKPNEIAAACDVVFLAIPHGESIPIVSEILNNGKKAIDLSADFRLKNADTYAEWYKLKHSRPDLLQTAVYGLSELYPNEIKNASLIANPGCYPTTAILGLAPLLAKNSDGVELSSIIIDSNSGVSGGGRVFAKNYFDKEHPNHKPYNIAGAHRHIPEIEQELSRLTPENTPIKITFTPHIIPVERGMLSNIYINLKKSYDAEDIREQYRKFFEGKPFVKVLPEGQLPGIKDVVNTNFCEIAVNIDSRANRAVIISSIDNLIKGAAGQAVQNMNIMFGFDETEGML